jgi:hypothetical protein
MASHKFLVTELVTLAIDNDQFGHILRPIDPAEDARPGGSRGGNPMETDMSLFSTRPQDDRAAVEAARQLVSSPAAAQNVHPLLRLAAWHILGDEMRQRRLAQALILFPSQGGDAA